MTKDESIGDHSIIVNDMPTWLIGTITAINFDNSGKLSVAVSSETQKWNVPKQAYSNALVIALGQNERSVRNLAC